MLAAMLRTGSVIVKALAVLVAIVFAIGVITLFADPFFGSSKIKPLFGMSAEALARGHLDGGASVSRTAPRPDTDGGGAP